MSALNPGGCRTYHGARIFGYNDIKFVTRRAKPDHAARGNNSIATQPHEHKREIARHRRQRERQEAKHG